MVRNVKDVFLNPKARSSRRPTSPSSPDVQHQERHRAEQRLAAAVAAAARYRQGHGRPAEADGELPHRAQGRRLDHRPGRPGESRRADGAGDRVGPVEQSQLPAGSRRRVTQNPTRRWSSSRACCRARAARAAAPRPARRRWRPPISSAAPRQVSRRRPAVSRGRTRAARHAIPSVRSPGARRSRRCRSRSAPRRRARTPRHRNRRRDRRS